MVPRDGPVGLKSDLQRADARYRITATMIDATFAFVAQDTGTGRVRGQARIVSGAQRCKRPANWANIPALQAFFPVI